MHFITRIFLTLLICLGMRGAIAAGNDGAVGMVLDLKGSGELITNGRTSKLQLLSYLKPQTQVKLNAGGKASVSLYATRSVYQITGPALVEVGKDKLNVLQGEAPLARSMSEKLVAAAETSNIVPGAMRIRGVDVLKLLTPLPGTVLLEGNPILSWESNEDTAFDVTVMQAPGKVVYSAKVNETSLQLPASVLLENGNSYQWSVSYKSADGNQASRSSEFSVASTADQEAFAAMRPVANAPIEEWVLYAATLQSRHYNEEARKVWRMIAQQRPDLAKVQEFAR